MNKKDIYLRNILDKIKHSDVFIFPTGMTNSFIINFRKYMTMMDYYLR